MVVQGHASSKPDSHFPHQTFQTHLGALPPAQKTSPSIALWEANVLADLATMSYEEVSAKHGISRGKIWKLALRHNARKNEARIQERAAARARRRKEFLQELLNASTTSDVLDFLDGLPDESVALHITSPPYNVGKPYGDAHLIDKHRFHYYIGWLLQVVSELARTTAQGGVICLQVGNTHTDQGARYPLDCVLFEHLCAMGLTYQDRVVWEFPHGLTPKNRLAERYEVMLIFSKGAPKTFNATPARTPQKEPDKRAFKGPNKGKLSGNPFGAHPTNVWRIRHLGHNHKERTGHPAQFPEELARRAVLLYTMPGDLVADVFSGSGTALAVAKKTGRAFVGADLYYEDLRAQRLAAIEPDLASTLPGVTPESIAIWAAEARAVTASATPS